MFATTAVPSLDGLSGIETLQRLISPSVHISHVGWNDKEKVTVAILEGEDNLLKQIQDNLKQYAVPFEQTRTISLAINKAKKLANVVEFDDVRQDTTNTL